MKLTTNDVFAKDALIQFMKGRSKEKLTSLTQLMECLKQVKPKDEPTVLCGQYTVLFMLKLVLEYHNIYTKRLQSVTNSEIVNIIKESDIWAISELNKRFFYQNKLFKNDD